MRKQSDKFLANLLIEKRKSKCSFMHLCKVTFKSYIMTVFSFCMLIAILYYFKANTIVMIYVLGMYVGMFIRDRWWFLRMKETWQFDEGIIDWQKVEQLADTNDDTK
jgi:hypothetical protein